jgi:hypothetical protein
MTAETVQILTLAREYVTKGWTQHTNARDAHGRACDFASRKACRWCLHGAVLRASWEIARPRYDAAAEQAEKALGPWDNGTCPMLWNDAMGRTQAEVVALFDQVLDPGP